MIAMIIVMVMMMVMMIVMMMVVLVEVLPIVMVMVMVMIVMVRGWRMRGWMTVLGTKHFRWDCVSISLQQFWNEVYKYLPCIS